jgi:hypothetical protein
VSGTGVSSSAFGLPPGAELSPLVLFCQFLPPHPDAHFEGRRKNIYAPVYLPKSKKKYTHAPFFFEVIFWRFRKGGARRKTSRRNTSFGPTGVFVGIICGRTRQKRSLVANGFD